MSIKIVKTKKGFRVKYYSPNGEMLSHSEIIETKVNARKNIKAMKKLMEDFTIEYK